MPLYGIDAATPPPSGSIKAAGYVALAYYMRDFTPQRMSRDLAAGLAVWFCTETTADRPSTSGYAGGLADGRRFGAMLDAAGVPRHRPLYAAQDRDTPGTQFSAVGAHLDGLREGSGRPAGIYAGADLVDWAMGNGHATFGWVTGALSWSHRHASSLAQLVQLVGHELFPIPGASYDDNLIRADDYGQHPFSSPHPPTITGDPFTMERSIIAVETKSAQFVIDPSRGSARLIDGTEAQALTALGWPTVTVPAGSPMHELLDREYERTNYQPGFG